MANAGYLPGPQRRRQILEGAKRVFATRGYHDTNISHICDDLGIGRGTLYQYFGSKKEVFAAVIEDLLERIRTAVAQREAPDLTQKYDRDTVIRWAASNLQRILEAVLSDEASLRIVLREAVGLDLHIDSILKAIDEIVVERVARDIEQAQEAGIIRRDVDTRIAAYFTVGGIQKLALVALTRDDMEIDPARIALEATRNNLIGLLDDEVR